MPELDSGTINLLVGFLIGMFGVKAIDILTDAYYYRIRKHPLYIWLVGANHED